MKTTLLLFGLLFVFGISLAMNSLVAAQSSSSSSSSSSANSVSPGSASSSFPSSSSSSGSGGGGPPASSIGSSSSSSSSPSSNSNSMPVSPTSNGESSSSQSANSNSALVSSSSSSSSIGSVATTSAGSAVSSSSSSSSSSSALQTSSSSSTSGSSSNSVSSGSLLASSSSSSFSSSGVLPTPLTLLSSTTTTATVTGGGGSASQQQSASSGSSGSGSGGPAEPSSTTLLLSSTSIMVTTAITDGSQASSNETTTSATTVDAPVTAPPTTSPPPFTTEPQLTFATTVAASLPAQFPFAGYQMALRPVLNSTRREGSNGNDTAPVTAAELQQLTRDLVFRLANNDTADFAEAFRADLGAFIEVPAGDIAVVNVEVDPRDPTGQTLLVKFKVALVRKSNVAQRLLSQLPNATASADNNASSSFSDNNNKDNNPFLSNGWSTSMMRLMNTLIDSNSTGISVVGVEPMWAAPDTTQITPVPANLGKGCADSYSAFCFLECDCAGSIMIIVSIVVCFVAIGVSIWQHYEMKKWTAREDLEHSALEKEVDARNEVREKLEKAGQLGPDPTKPQPAKSTAMEQEMTSQPLLVPPQPMYHPQQQQQQQAPQASYYSAGAVPAGNASRYEADFDL